MKITKDYLRQLIRESLEKNESFTPAQLPYERGANEAKRHALQQQIRDAHREIQTALKGVPHNSEQEKEYFASEEYARLLNTIFDAKEQLKAI